MEKCVKKQIFKQNNNIDLKNNTFESAIHCLLLHLGQESFCNFMRYNVNRIKPP